MEYQIREDVYRSRSQQCSVSINTERKRSILYGVSQVHHKVRIVHMAGTERRYAQSEKVWNGKEGTIEIGISFFRLINFRLGKQFVLGKLLH